MSPSSLKTCVLAFFFLNTDAFPLFSIVGEAGDITLGQAQEIILQDSLITAQGFDGGGNIMIDANQFLAMGSQIETVTVNEPGGNVTIVGEAVELTKGSTITSSTSGNAGAGDLTLNATDHVKLSEIGGIDRPSGLFSNSFGFFGSLGGSGGIQITTPLLEMADGARINTVTSSSGSGGDVTINASQSVSISGEVQGISPEPLFSLGSLKPSGIFTSTIGGSCIGPCGNAGKVSITTVDLTIEPGGQINSGTSSSGNGGNVAVNATEAITISGTLSDGTSSGIFSRSISTDPDAGRGGNIVLTAGESFFLGNGSAVSASSTGPANAGDIQLTAVDTILLDEAMVTTEAAQASGGNIKLTAEDLIQLNDSVISSSVQGDENTAGGNINVDPEFIILQDSQILAKAVEGQGGNITLIANQAVLVDSFSVLDASSALGVSGSVNIEAPTKFLSGAIVPLEKQPVEVATLYGARCAAGAGGNFSTFVDSKIDSLSPTPGSFLASPLLTPSAQTNAMADSSSISPSPVVLTASIAPLLLGSAGEPMTACP